VLCVSVVEYSSGKVTTETQRTQRLHREELYLLERIQAEPHGARYRTLVGSVKIILNSKRYVLS
jgi:hypothetical protein